MRLLLVAILVAGGSVPSIALAAADPRADIQRALAAPQAVAVDHLRDHVLYPYLRAAQLRASLGGGDVPDAAIRDFLAEHGDAPYTQALRLGWWRDLVRRRQWAAFLDAAPTLPADPQLRCHWLQAHLHLERFEGLRDAALAVWTTGRDMPAACDPAFTWLAQQAALDAPRYRQRLRLALDANQTRLARHLLRQLPEAEQRKWTNAVLVRERRAAHIQRLIRSPEAPVPFEDLHAAFFRHARGQPEAARRLLDALLAARPMSVAEADRLRRASALGLAYARRPEALPLFAELGDAARDEDVHEWHARNALWAGRWREAGEVVAAMPAPLRQLPRWRYWAARIDQREGRAESAQAGFAALAAEDRGFYGFLAATRVGLPPRLAPARTPRDAAVQAQLQAMPAVQRARELLALEMRGEAAAELRWAFAALDIADRRQVALLLDDWGWHDQAATWLASARFWDDLWLRFPLPYRSSFTAAAEASRVPAVWLYTVARTESLLNPRAVSPAGARGIAQVMPATARSVARSIDLPYSGPDELFDVDINLRIGGEYIARMLERFDGHWLLALAAYNAGPGRIPGWLPPETMEPDVWIENIPFNETRGYVQRALYHRVIIGWRMSGEAEDLAPWLRPVPARVGDAAS